MLTSTIHAILRDYPLIYLACHSTHTRARQNPHGVTTREASLLAHLDTHQPLALGELATHFRVCRSALSATIRRLEGLKLLERRQHPSDRRVAHLILTPEGLEAVHQDSILDPARVAAVLAVLTEDERAQALSGLHLLAQAAQALPSTGARP